ncbi:MAG: hypothetical protein SPL94_08125 [Oribacterium sp.]|jgi:hypothetical protein|nr:hypothetical protein [Oribacterium sp.]
MADVTYTISKDQKLSEEQIKMIEEGRKYQDKLLEEGRYEEVFDEDCPSTDPELNPEGYAALVKAVGKRNRMLAELAKKRA